MVHFKVLRDDGPVGNGGRYMFALEQFKQLFEPMDTSRENELVAAAVVPSSRGASSSLDGVVSRTYEHAAASTTRNSESKRSPLTRPRGPKTATENQDATVPEVDAAKYLKIACTIAGVDQFRAGQLYATHMLVLGSENLYMIAATGHGKSLPMLVALIYLRDSCTEQKTVLLLTPLVALKLQAVTDFTKAGLKQPQKRCWTSISDATGQLILAWIS